MKNRLLLNQTPEWALRLIYAMQSLAKVPFPSKLADKNNSLSCQPLFIISPGRSGTTLLRSMLVAGGEIAIPPESFVIGPTILKFVSINSTWNDLVRLVVAQFESHPKFHRWEIDLQPAYGASINIPYSERSLARIIDEIFCCYLQQKFPKAVCWGDKSPINTFYLRWISKTYPRAKYIHMLRDGRDVVASAVERGRDVKSAVHRWNYGTRECLKLANEVGSERFLVVRYEELVSEPVSTLCSVCSFLGLDYKSRMLDYWKLPTTVEHRYEHHHQNLTKPVSTKSIGRWPERLEGKQKEYVEAHTHALLVRLGYLHQD